MRNLRADENCPPTRDPLSGIYGRAMIASE